ncbi:MAG: hypothetical protein FWF09_06355 [Bacteroidales bacterium]|nr:hypothetical protein [Bacteroidales bacterium]
MFNPVWSIWVKNDSDKDVYFVLGFDWKNNGYYPTTQLPNDSTRLWRVKPDRKIPLNYSPDKVKINSGDSIALFVFDPDTVAKYTWKQLSIGEKYLKKYEFKCEELNANPDNYIAYP